MADTYRIGEVAEQLGVSVDTLRRWADQGQIRMTRSKGGQRVVAATELARVLARRSKRAPVGKIVANSARNRFSGVVTRVVKDHAAATVELQAGPHRLVSLITREAVDDLRLRPGMRAVAVVKATSVTIELPE